MCVCAHVHVRTHIYIPMYTDLLWWFLWRNHINMDFDLRVVVEQQHDEDEFLKLVLGILELAL